MLLLRLVSGVTEILLPHFATIFSEEQMEQDKRKVQSMADIMKNPTKIVLLQV